MIECNNLYFNVCIDNVLSHHIRNCYIDVNHMHTLCISSNALVLLTSDASSTCVCYLNYANSDVPQNSILVSSIIYKILNTPQTVTITEYISSM